MERWSENSNISKEDWRETKEFKKLPQKGRLIIEN